MWYTSMRLECSFAFLVESFCLQYRTLLREKTFEGENFWGRKLLREKTFEGENFRGRKLLREKNFWGRKLLREKPFEGETFWGRNLLREKPFEGETFWGRKLLREKPFEGENFWGRKLLREKTFEGETFWGRNLLREKTFEGENFRGRKLLREKNFWGRKTFEGEKLLREKTFSHFSLFRNHPWKSSPQNGAAAPVHNNWTYRNNPRKFYPQIFRFIPKRDSFLPRYPWVWVGTSSHETRIRRVAQDLQATRPVLPSETSIELNWIRRYPLPVTWRTLHCVSERGIY